MIIYQQIYEIHVELAGGKSTVVALPFMGSSDEEIQQKLKEYCDIFVGMNTTMNIYAKKIGERTINKNERKVKKINFKLD